MKALTNLRGRWNPQRCGIEFSWDVSGLDNDQFVFIFPVIEQNGVMHLNMERRIKHDASNLGNGLVNGAFLNLNNVSHLGVSVFRFCGVSQSEARLPQEAEIICACANKDECIVSVMVGHAEVEFDCKRTDAGNATVIEIELSSNSNIALGALGYKYRCGSQTCRERIPIAIQKGGTITLPPIAIPSDSDFQLVPYDDRFAGNIRLIQKRKLTLLETIKKLFARS